MKKQMMITYPQQVLQVLSYRNKKKALKKPKKKKKGKKKEKGFVMKLFFTSHNRNQ